MGIAFRDRKGRLIEIEEPAPDVEAYHEGKKIGTISVEGFEDGFGNWHERLFYMEVEPEYRRAGIARAMMKVVAECYGPYIDRPSFSAVGGSSAKSSADYFTTEGAALVRSCIEDGILEDIEYGANE